MKKSLLLSLLVAILGIELTAQTTHQVSVTNNVFTPENLTIEAGDIVQWNCTQGSHNVNGTNSTYPSNPESFGNSVGINWTYSYTFNTAGFYDYQCDPHVGLGMVGTITVNPSTPDNDDCANATLLTVGSSCVMQSFNSENHTAENPQPAPSPGCGFFQGSDVWFKAVVPASGALRVERENGTMNAQFAVYSGTCGNMEVVTCAQLDGARTIHRPDLAGQEVYIRVWRYNSATGGTFDICVWEPEIPVNNYCADAIPLTVGQECELDTFTCVYATADTTPNQPSPGCGFYSGGDVWFTFDVPASGALRIERVNISGNAQYAVYDGTCGDFTVLDCAQLDAETTLYLPNQAGETLYLRVWGYNTEEGAEFAICLWEPPIPENDNCADAISIPVGETCILQQFSGYYATPDSTGTAPSPGCGFYSGGDIWFTFEMPASGELRIDRNNIGGNAQYAVYSGVCGDMEVVNCAQLDDGRTIVEPDLAGEILYLRVFGYNSEEGAEFEICLWDPPVPVNDLCANAIELPVGDTCNFSAFSSRYATTDTTGTAPSPGCGFYSGGDVWFTVEMPATGMLHLERENISGNAQFALYEGTCGNFTSVIDCAQLTSEMELNNTGLGGETLYLRVFGYNSEEGAEFEFCAYDTTCNSFEVSAFQVGNELWAQPTGQNYSYLWIGCEPTPDPLYTTSVYQPNESGSYRVMIANEIGCIDTSECVNVTVTGLDEALESQLQVYPNPSTGRFEISLADGYQNANLQVLDLQGKLVYEQTLFSNRSELDLRSFSVGVYSLRIMTNSGTITRKLTLQR